jgi:hypothetical protein
MGRWCSNEPLGSNKVGLLKNIRRGSGMFSSHTRFEVRDGSKIRFFFFEKSIALNKSAKGRKTLGALGVYKGIREKGKRKKENQKN